MCHYWNKIVEMDNGRWPAIVFRWESDLKIKNSWFMCMRELLYSLGLNDNFNDRTTVPINTIWSLLHERHCNQWLSSINNMPKLRTYVLFKKVYEPEPYVFIIFYE